MNEYKPAIRIFGLYIFSLHLSANTMILEVEGKFHILVEGVAMQLLK